MTPHIIRLTVGVAIAEWCLFATGCRGTAPPLSAAEAKRPFLVRGFTIGCPNLGPKPDGLIHDLGIAQHGKFPCEPTLGALDIYRDSTKAAKACSPSPIFFCGPPVYRVRNVVLYIGLKDSAAMRQRLLRALRSLGTPTRIA